MKGNLGCAGLWVLCTGDSRRQKEPKIKNAERCLDCAGMSGLHVQPCLHCVHHVPCKVRTLGTVCTTVHCVVLVSRVLRVVSCVLCAVCGASCVLCRVSVFWCSVLCVRCVCWVCAAVCCCGCGPLPPKASLRVARPLRGWPVGGFPVCALCVLCFSQVVQGRARRFPPRVARSLLVAPVRAGP